MHAPAATRQAVRPNGQPAETTNGGSTPPLPTIHFHGISFKVMVPIPACEGREGKREGSGRTDGPHGCRALCHGANPFNTNSGLKVCYRASPEGKATYLAKLRFDSAASHTCRPLPRQGVRQTFFDILHNRANGGGKGETNNPRPRYRWPSSAPTLRGRLPRFQSMIRTL